MEFERRIQLISPDLIIDEKPNSDLIFSILNEAQDRYVMMNYVGDDQMETETNIHTRNTDSIKSLLVEKEQVLLLMVLQDTDYHMYLLKNISYMYIPLVK